MLIFTKIANFLQMGPEIGPGFGFAGVPVDGHQRKMRKDLMGSIPEKSESRFYLLKIERPPDGGLSG